MTPIITVLMPVYNGQKHLRLAIDSILHQTFSQFEFLIIDDGSTDNSEEIILSYNDPRIRFIKNEKNLGISATLNKGITLASCELIARMDSDDISYPDRLQKQYDYFQQHPDCAVLSTWLKYRDRLHKEGIVPKYRSEYCYYFLVFNCWINHPTVMYKRSAVMDVGMYSETYSEDYNLWCKISRKYKISILEETLLDYRDTENSLSRVVRKSEYEQAHNNQIINNVRFYTGKDLQLSEEELQFFRGIHPVLNEKNKKLVIECFRKLDYITACVQKVDNINKVSNNNIKKAAYYKKILLLRKLNKCLNNREIIAILFELGYWKLLLTKVFKIMAKKAGKLSFSVFKPAKKTFPKYEVNQRSISVKECS